MTVYAFILTYLVGGFTITPAFIYVFFKCEERQQMKKREQEKTHLEKLQDPEFTFTPDILKS